MIDSPLPKGINSPKMSQPKIDFNQTEWFLNVGGSRVGPFTREQIIGLAADGEVPPQQEVTSPLISDQWISVQDLIDERVPKIEEISDINDVFEETAPAKMELENPDPKPEPIPEPETHRKVVYRHPKVPERPAHLDPNHAPILNREEVEAKDPAAHLVDSLKSVRSNSDAEGQPLGTIPGEAPKKWIWIAGGVAAVLWIGWMFL